jgi:hypothetical protein
MAREGRLFLKEKRVFIEKTRKDLKEQSLREGKAIDGIANVLKALIEPIEKYLEQQEKFIEIQEDNRIEEQKLKRIELLAPYIPDLSAYDLKNMTDNAFNYFLESQKKIKEAAIQAEQERLEKEKADKEERERIQAENERLKKEQLEKENQLKAEREKVEKERQEQEKIIAIEKEKTRLAELELKRKEDEELKQKKEAEELERKKQNAPDKEKLILLAKSITDITLPDVNSEAAKIILLSVKILLDKVVAYINEKVEKI